MLFRILLVSSLLFILACHHQLVPETKESVECATDTDCKDGKTCQKNQCLQSQQTGKISTQSDQVANCAMTGTVYFDFNVDEIKPEGLDLLTEVASCIRSNPNKKFLIAGNTDDRGTVEYNLALGEKRAQAVAKYLQNSGIDDSRMHIISYGKEKPVDLAKNEEAWAKNRRTDITLDN